MLQRIFVYLMRQHYLCVGINATRRSVDNAAPITFSSTAWMSARAIENNRPNPPDQNRMHNGRVQRA